MGSQFPSSSIRPAIISNDPAAYGAALLAFGDIWSGSKERVLTKTDIS